MNVAKSVRAPVLVVQCAQADRASSTHCKLERSRSWPSRHWIRKVVRSLSRTNRIVCRHLGFPVEEHAQDGGLSVTKGPRLVTSHASIYGLRHHRQEDADAAQRPHIIRWAGDPPARSPCIPSTPSLSARRSELQQPPSACGSDLRNGQPASPDCLTHAHSRPRHPRGRSGPRKPPQIGCRAAPERAETNCPASANHGRDSSTRCARSGE